MPSVLHSVRPLKVLDAVHPRVVQAHDFFHDEPQFTRGLGEEDVALGANVEGRD
jgi:hypothetical protein